MPGRPPLAVLVGGAPGSGKTTLARSLGRSLDLPVLHKDELVHGTWRTLDRAMDLGKSGVELFYRSMELWLDLGVSVVADMAFYRGLSERDVHARVASRAVVLEVHCRSAHALDRWKARMLADPLCGTNRLTKLLPIVEDLDRELSEPLDFDCPVLVVDTDDGYDPSLESITRWIDEIYSRPKVHELDTTGSVTTPEETGPGATD